MKAHLSLNAKQRQDIKKMAENILQEEKDRLQNQIKEEYEKLYEASQKERERINEQVNKEREDISKRCLYIVLLSMYQAGLSPKTMVRVQNAVPAVTEKFMEYRVEQLADEWARVTLQDIGVETPETKEKL